MGTTDERVPGGEGSRHALERGDLVGRYVVLSELGRGGMGVVHAAYDPELDRKVALKLLHEHVGSTKDTDGHKRLLREAQAMARLSHPNVITVHDVGTHAGRVFVAMEFVEGQTLGSWLKTDRPWLEVLDVFVRAGRGLVAAHQQSLVHRDFKPDNVMVGADGRVRVMDFGLARPTTSPVQPERSNDEGVAKSKDTTVRPNTDALGSDLTGQGSVIGTPAYMAPEQHLGLEVDARTDQFSFCVALWEGLFRERPFGGETVPALAFSVTQGRLREPPSGSRVPSWLRKVTARGLAADPNQRFESMASLLEAAEQGTTRRRRRLGIAAGGLVVLAGAGAWGGLELDRRHRWTSCVVEADGIAEVWNEGSKARLRQALVRAADSFGEATFERAVPFVDEHANAWRQQYEELCVATVVERQRSNELWLLSRRCLEHNRLALELRLEVLMEASSPAMVQETTVAVAGLRRFELCADEAWLNRNLGDEEDSELSDDLRRARHRAEALSAAAQFEEALAIAKDLLAKTASSSPGARINALYLAGGLHQNMAHQEEARQMLGEAFDLALASGFDRGALVTASSLIFNAGKAGRHAEGLWWGRVASGIATRIGAEQGLAAGAMHNYIGTVYQDQQRYDAAERELEEGLAIFENLLGPNHPNVASNHSNLGNLYRAQGNYARAERAHAHALAIWERSLGENHPHVGVACTNLAGDYVAQQRYDDAEPLLDRSRAINEAVLGPDHPSVASALSSLGTVYRQQRHYEEAERTLTRALGIFEQAFGADHHHVAMSHMNLATVYELQSRYGEAERAHLRAVGMFEQILGPDHPDLAKSYGNLGRLYATQRRYEQAEQAHARSLAIFERAFGPHHHLTAHAQSNLASVWRHEHRDAKALRAYARAISMFERARAAHDPMIAATLVGSAIAKLKLDRPADAVPDARRAVEIREKHDTDPTQLAHARFALARALWSSNADRVRARELAESARDAYRDGGDATAVMLAEVEGWLSKHRL